LAAVGACVFALQALPVPLLAAEATASCCCRHHADDANCKCPVCAHERESRSGKPFFKSCGSSAPVAAVTTKEPAVPSVVAVAAAPVPQLPAQVRIASPPEVPDLDVPTPPPLARA
jgi:hypothetical protein